MPDKVIPLSVANVRALVSNFKELTRELGDDIPVAIEQETCGIIAERVQLNIAGIPDVQGNYLGSDNPNASVTVRNALVGHIVQWVGKQIAFLEFGAGADAAADQYPGPAMGASGYHPNPTKEEWFYQDTQFDRHHAFSWAPWAPMYQESVIARTTRLPRRVAISILNKAVRRAVTIR